MMYKGIIQDDIESFYAVDSDHEIFKVDQDTINFNNSILQKAMAQPTGGKAKPESWSVRLLRENPNSRWVTIRGNRVLIRGNADGTASVVFSGNPALEHLKIVPKTHKDFNEVKRKSKENKDGQEDKKEPNKEVKKEGKKAQEKITTSYIDNIRKIIGVKKEEEKEREGNNPIKKNLDKAKQDDNENLGDLSGKLGDKPKSVQKKAAKALNFKAEQTLGEGVLEDVIGKDGLFEDSEIPKTGDKEIDDEIEKIKLTTEQAADIISSTREEGRARKRVRGKVKAEDLNSIKMISNVDWSNIKSSVDEEVEALLSKRENIERAKLNTEFYNILSDRSGKPSVNKATIDGARQSFNAVSSLVDNSEISGELIDVLGINNTAILLASKIKESGEDQKDFEKYWVNSAQDVVKNTVEEAQEKYRAIESYEELGNQGILAKKTAAINKARQLGQLGKDIGLAAGSLEAISLVNDKLKDKDEDQPLTFKVDKDVNWKSIFKKIGLSEDDFSVRKLQNGKTRITIPTEYFGKLFKKNKELDESDKKVRAIKSGEALEKDWRPDGTPETFFDFKTPEQMESKFGNSIPGEWEKYKNNPGEDGYTSQYKEGAELYRKEVPIKFKDSQQRMIKMALEQKRTVWNAGAGLGKTVAFLGAISALKDQGKLEGSFAVMSPPSRLRDEFFKDKEKFYPGMNVLELDNIKDPADKKKALEEAKAGKYDIVLTGHDTVKNKGTADVLAEMKPAFVGLDEAHETFKAEGQKTSGRFEAIKKLAESSEYFVPATGTPVRNNIGEFSSLLHYTRPDRFPSEKAFTNKYKNINQSSVAFNDHILNQFRKEYDDVVISESTKIEPKKIENKNNIKLSDKQQQSYKESERVYRIDRDSSGFGLQDENGNLVFSEGDKLKTLDGVDFKPSKSGRQRSKAELKLLKEKGFNPDKYRVVKLGKEGAAARRDSRHDRILNAGDYKSNAKVQNLLSHMENNKDDKHIVFFKRKDTKETLKEGMSKQLGLKPDQIAVIDGKVRMNQRKQQVKKFQTDPNVKVILLSDAGATGLNLQSADHVHHISRSDTFALQEQQNARAYRTGRDKDVNTHYYDSNTPYDNNKVGNVKKKKKISDSLGDYDSNLSISSLANVLNKSVDIDLFGNSFKKPNSSNLPLPSPEEANEYCDVIVANEFGEILLLQRSALDKFGALSYCLPGGGAEDGETAINAALRVLYEETFLTVNHLSHLRDYINSNGSLTRYFYTFLSKEGQEIIINSDKHQSYIWATPLEMRRVDTLLDTCERVCSIFGLEKGVVTEILDIDFNTHQDGWLYKQYMGESINRERKTMPQVKYDNIPDLLLHFSKKGIPVTKVKRTLSELKPSQNEISEMALLDKIRESNQEYIKRQYIISGDDYLMDGHHDWAYGLEKDPFQEVNCYRISLPVKELLKRANLLKITTKA